MTPPVTVTEVPPRAALHLLTESHALMRSLFPAESNHFLSIEALEAANIRFYGATSGDRIIGCGALAVQEGYGELKSMFVDPAARGRGVGDMLVGKLVAVARSLGLPVVRLETGTLLDAAHRLYARHGFVVTGPFGDYAEEPYSVFMEKRVS